MEYVAGSDLSLLVHFPIRKMRDVKRDRYAKKELVKLKECAERLQKTKDSCLSAAEMTSSSLYQLVTPEAITKDTKAPTATEMDVRCDVGVKWLFYVMLVMSFLMYSSGFLFPVDVFHVFIMIIYMVSLQVEMEARSSNSKKKSFGKTDKNGQYPVWMSQRNVKRLQKKNGKKKQLKKKNKAQK